MICQVVSLPNGGSAIVCSGGRRPRCKCGGPAPLLCDWKVSGKKSGTCDAPLCASCTTSPAPNKDLCPEHAREFDAWKAVREGDEASEVNHG